MRYGEAQKVGCLIISSAIYRGVFRVNQMYKVLLTVWTAMLLFATGVSSASGLVPGQSAQDVLTPPTLQLSGRYMENKGQWDENVFFATSGPGLRFWATRGGMVMDAYATKSSTSFDPSTGKIDKNVHQYGQVVEFKFANANPKARPEGVGPSSVRIDFLGFGPRRSAKNVKAFNEAFVRDMVRGVDARYYRTTEGARYDLIVKPGTDPSVIQMEVNGANGLSILPDGALGVHTSVGILRQAGLKVFQNINGRQIVIPASFTVQGNRVGFQIGNYDRTKPLIIDPLVYGSHFGGNAGFDGAVGYDEVMSTASDSNGNLYVTGLTQSIDLPTTTGVYGIQFLTDGDPADLDGFLAALQGDAYTVTYVAYVGGPGIDRTEHIQVDQYGNVWLAGDTTTEGFLTDSQGFTLQEVRPITGGDFALSYRGLVTDPIQFNATAQDVADALNNLDPAFLPPGGFSATGGPLPADAVIIRAAPDVFPIRIIQRTRPYIVTGGGANQTIEMDGTGIGFFPNDGEFSLRLQDDTNITDPLPWNAVQADVIAALSALPLLQGGTPPRVVGGANAGPLPLDPIDIQFQNAGAPENRPLMTVVNSTLDGGALGFAANPVGFITKFSFSPTEVLDPFTNPVVFPIEGATDVRGFSIRPIAQASGNVEMAIAGQAETIADIPGQVPTGSGPNPEHGFYAVCRYIPNTTNFQLISARSSYIGGTANASISGVVMDADGGVYVAGNVYLPNPASQTIPPANTNAVLGPASTNRVFYTSAGVYTNGGLLRLQDGFVRKYAPNGAIVYSATLGGSSDDTLVGIAVDNTGNAYVTGAANSFNFPRTVGAFDQIFGSEPYVTKINASASQILYSTGLQARNAASSSIAVDGRGNAYITGVTAQTPAGPGVILTPAAPFLDGQEAALDVLNQGGFDLDSFLTVLNSTAVGVLYSSYIGEAASQEFGNHLQVDRTGGVWVSGFTGQWALGPIGLNNAYKTPLGFKLNPDSSDGWLIKMKFILPVLQSITVNPNQVAGGLGSTADVTVTLRQPAPAGGTTVTLRIIDPTFARWNTETGPTLLQVTIPAGQTTMTAPAVVATRIVLDPKFTDIRAELDGDFLQTRLNIRPWIDQFTLSATAVTGGTTVNGILGIFQNAPAAGITATLTANSDRIVFPNNGSVSIAAGTNIISFPIITRPVSAPVNVTLTATIANVSISKELRLIPANISTLTIDPSRVSGGESSVGTVRLDGPAGADTVVTLSEIGQDVDIPATVTIPEGASTATFDIGTPFVASNTSTRIRASLNSFVAEDTLFIESTNIASLTVSQTNVLGGTVVTGQVNLTRPAGPTGLTIPITNTDPTAGVVTPSTVIVAPGAVVGNFTVQTNLVPTTRSMTIATNKPGYSNKSVTITVRAIAANLVMNPNTVIGGLENSTGTIQLLGGEVAPPGGLRVNLVSSNPAVLSVPATVTVPVNSATVNFTATSSTTAIDRTVTITAVLAPGNVATAQVTVLSPRIIALTLTPKAVTGGQSSIGKVRLSNPAPSGGVVVQLATNRPTNAFLPSSITIPAGQTEREFTITTVAVPNKVNATIRAQVSSSVLTNVLEILPPGISAFTFNPSIVSGGINTRGTITLNSPAPAGGLVIALESLNVNFVRVPVQVMVPAGQTTVSFNAGTSRASRTIAVQIRATVADRGPVSAWVTITGTP